MGFTTYSHNLNPWNTYAIETHTATANFPDGKSFHYTVFVSSSFSNVCRQWIKSSAALVIVLGLTWIVGVFFFHKTLTFVAYIFTTIVASQVRDTTVVDWEDIKLTTPTAPINF